MVVKVNEILMNMEEIKYTNHEQDIDEFESQIHSTKLPSKNWLYFDKNRNNEICRDAELENIYRWQKTDDKKDAKEYRGMVNDFRKRLGWEEIV